MARAQAQAIAKAFALVWPGALGLGFSHMKKADITQEWSAFFHGWKY